MTMPKDWMAPCIPLESFLGLRVRGQLRCVDYHRPSDSRGATLPMTSGGVNEP